MLDEAEKHIIEWLDATGKELGEQRHPNTQELASRWMQDSAVAEYSADGVIIK